MTKKKVIGVPFKKGQSGNPSGRPKMFKTPAERAFAAKTRTEVAVRTLELITMSHEEAKLLATREDLPLWERAMLSVAINAIKQGDVNRLERMMVLAFGPQKTAIELTGADGKSLIPKDPELSGKKLTEAIDTVRAIMQAKRDGKLQFSGKENG